MSEPNTAPTPSVPAICDRCRSIGSSGEGDFSHLGDLLDFEPVPRRQRVNGWDADAQRALIAALAMTGSKTRAAKSLGRNAFGVDQLLKAKGSEGFRLAYDRAMAIAARNGSMRIATGVADAAARNEWLDRRSALRGHAPEPEPEITMSDEEKWSLIENIGAKFLRKVEAEREARLEGRIVAADFYLRQITFMEVLFDLTASQFGWAADEALSELRRGGHGVRDIVSTPFADVLDRVRRDYWQEQGDPPRPEHPDRRTIADHHDGPWGERGPEGYSTQPDQCSYGALTAPARGYTPEQWAEMNNDEQRAARQQQFTEDAEAQIQWEAKARRVTEEWRKSETSEDV